MANERAGLYSKEVVSQAADIQPAEVGTAYIQGIFERGKVGVPIEINHPDEIIGKVGYYLYGYYGAKCIKAAFDEGNTKVIANRIVKYTSGVKTSVISSFSAQASAEGEDPTDKAAFTISAYGDGEYGDRINFSTLKAETTTTAGISAGATTSVAVTSTDDLEVGDVVVIDDDSVQLKVVITAIDSLTIYFKSVTMVGVIASGATVKTVTEHVVRTTLSADLATGVTTASLTNAYGVEVGSILSIVDTQTGSPNSVNVKVTGVNGNDVSFAAITLGATILAANSEVVSQEFNLTTKLNTVELDEDGFKNLSLVVENEKNYIESRISGWNIEVTEAVAGTDPIEFLPNPYTDQYLSGGDNGLTSIADADFIGTEADSNGFYVYDQLPDQFAQISCPDRRNALVQNAMNNYADTRKLIPKRDFDFNKTPAQAIDFVNNTATINSSTTDITYPNLKFYNDQKDTYEDIPASGFDMGLNARIWINKGTHVSAAGIKSKDGIYKTVQGLENDYTKETKYLDQLAENRINAVVKKPGFGYTMMDINVMNRSVGPAEINQKAQRAEFYFIQHSIINSNADFLFTNKDANAGFIAKISKFLSSRKEAGALQAGYWDTDGNWVQTGKDEDAFTIDVSQNNQTTEAAGKYYIKIGVNLQNAKRQIYFTFTRKAV